MKNIMKNEIVKALEDLDKAQAIKCYGEYSKDILSTCDTRYHKIRSDINSRVWDAIARREGFKSYLDACKNNIVYAYASKYKEVRVRIVEYLISRHERAQKVEKPIEKFYKYEHLWNTPMAESVDARNLKFRSQESEFESR